MKYIRIYINAYRQLQNKSVGTLYLKGNFHSFIIFHRMTSCMKGFVKMSIISIFSQHEIGINTSYVLQNCSNYITLCYGIFAMSITFKISYQFPLGNGMILMKNKKLLFSVLSSLGFHTKTKYLHPLVTGDLQTQVGAILCCSADLTGLILLGQSLFT